VTTAQKTRPSTDLESYRLKTRFGLQRNRREGSHRWQKVLTRICNTEHHGLDGVRQDGGEKFDRCPQVSPHCQPRAQSMRHGQPARPPTHARHAVSLSLSLPNLLRMHCYNGGATALAYLLQSKEPGERSGDTIFRPRRRPESEPERRSVMATDLFGIDPRFSGDSRHTRHCSRSQGLENSIYF
jgi:hypothetical protein